MQEEIQNTEEIRKERDKYIKEYDIMIREKKNLEHTLMQERADHEEVVKRFKEQLQKVAQERQEEMYKYQQKYLSLMEQMRADAGQ